MTNGSAPDDNRMKSVLFIAEAATLAHIARPLALAATLDPASYRVELACDDRCRWLTDRYPFPRHTLSSQHSGRFLEALAKGSPVFDAATLRAYVKDDLALLARVKPDLVVGDFRLSLSVSARLAQIPFLAISNAYWSPYARQRYVVGSLPMTRVLPIALANLLFNAARPAAFAYHTLPLNRVRRENGLGSLGCDLRRIYCDGDWVAYADLPELFPLSHVPPNHRFLGPVIWSPPVRPPDWWDALPADRPIVYVTLGSSGLGSLLPQITAALADLPLTVIAATAATGTPFAAPANAWVTDYLPGLEAARRSRLVICNGGSPTSQQALAAGVPIIGLATNLDQFLNMAAIESAGAGVVLRADRFSANMLRAHVQRFLGGESGAAARQLATSAAACRCERNFPRLVAQAVAPGESGGD